jgi:hypothetical protein
LITLRLISSAVALYCSAAAAICWFIDWMLETVWVTFSSEPPARRTNSTLLSVRVWLLSD